VADPGCPCCVLGQSRRLAEDGTVLGGDRSAQAGGGLPRGAAETVGARALPRRGRGGRGHV
jgi:hypothetical protein